MNGLIYRIILKIKKISEDLYQWAWVRSAIKEGLKIGQNVSLGMPVYGYGLENVKIGDNFKSGNRLKLRTFNKWGGVKYNPTITIGDNVNIESDCHISAINQIIIGDNVLIASFVYISDHSHGEIIKEELNIPPLNRTLYSKGPVIIEDNVWIGEKVTILPGVTIGENSIIGANSIVTKDIPANCVAAGIPAKVIKNLD